MRRWCATSAQSPLQDVQEARQKGRRKLSIVNQMLVLAIGGGAVAWKLSGAPVPFFPNDAAPGGTTQAQAAPVTTAAALPQPVQPPAPPAAVQPVMQSVPQPPAPGW